MSITAFYELPVPIWTSTEVLGERIRIGLGPLTYDLLMPTNDGLAGGTVTGSGLHVPAHDEDSRFLL